MIEITDVDTCHRWIADPDRTPAALRAIDLRDVDGLDDIATARFRGSLFLSCQLTPIQAAVLTASGATVIRDDGERPFAAHRAHLYDPVELFDGFDPGAGRGYDESFDARVYRHWTETGRQYPDMIDESLARRLHDHSITEALHDKIRGRRPVAVMGGHGIERSDPGYTAVARISRALAREGFLLLSGGGPGAMEATHLGAWMATWPDHALDEAVAVLSVRPADAPEGREYADPDWLDRAWVVRNRWPLADDAPVSIGIPTWMYGHEPPNAFATHLAKYFANSVREEGLLAIATFGVIFAPGSAGTIQEIFQDAAQNHYESFGPPSPMVLLGTEYWRDRYPVLGVLDALSRGRSYRELITVTDVEDEVVRAIADHDRSPFGRPDARQP